MGQAARERVEEKFSTAAMLQRYLQVIRDVNGQ